MVVSSSHLLPHSNIQSVAQNAVDIRPHRCTFASNPYFILILHLSPYSNAPRSRLVPTRNCSVQTQLYCMIPYLSPKSTASFAEWFGTCGPPGSQPLANLCWLGAIKRGGLKPNFNPAIGGTTQHPRPAKPNGCDGRTSIRQTSGPNSDAHMHR